MGAGSIGWDTLHRKLPSALSDPAVTRMLTVGDLFAHRSGLPDHAGDLLEDLGYDRRTNLGTDAAVAAGAVPGFLRLHQLG